MDTRSQWGVRKAGGSLQWEEHMVAGSRPDKPSLSDNGAPIKPLIFGPRGETLVEQRPRSIGFRMREDQQ